MPNDACKECGHASTEHVVPSCGACAAEESQGQRAAANVCRPASDMRDLIPVSDERHDSGSPSGAPRFPRVRNPYLRAAVSRLYSNGRLAFLCGILAPLALVVSVWSLLHGDIQHPVLWTIALLSALGVSCAVLVLRWDVAAIREDQATAGPSPH